MTSVKKYSILVISFILLFGITGVVYWSGLSGPFLLDDFDSLVKLGSTGGVDSWADLIAFLQSGSSGPTGRPLSLLSFLIDARNWPTDPFLFKRTNLVLHIINGLLLFAIVLRVLSVLGTFNSNKNYLWLTSFIVALVWLCHPFLMSTVLYSVQRMTILSALFSLSGILFYLHWRPKLSVNGSACLLNAWLLCIGSGVFTLLATFSKENGAVLPALLLAIECTVFAKKPIRSIHAKRLLLTCLVVPSLVIVAYLVYKADSYGFYRQLSHRQFSVYERLLTESRILLDYLQHWFLPKLYTSGVFHDDWQKSTSLLSPITTLLSVVIHGLVLVMAILYRKKLPLLCLAVLFFYIGHLIESTTVALELYFEHRNYLPVIFLFAPVVVWLLKALPQKYALLCVFLLPTIVIIMGAMSSQVWGDKRTLTVMWAQQAPKSPRANQQLAQMLYNEGRYSQASTVLRGAVERMPNDLSMRLWQVLLECRLSGLQRLDIELLLSLSERQPYDLRLFSLYEKFVHTVSNYCTDIADDEWAQVLTAFIESPVNQSKARQSQLMYFRGLYHLSRNHGDKAMTDFVRSLEKRPGVDSAMNLAALMATHGLYDYAIVLSDEALGYLEQGKSSKDGVASLVMVQEIQQFQITVRKSSNSETQFH